MARWKNIKTNKKRHFRGSVWLEVNKQSKIVIAELINESKGLFKLHSNSSLIKKEIRTLNPLKWKSTGNGWFTCTVKEEVIQSFFNKL